MRLKLCIGLALLLSGCGTTSSVTLMSETSPVQSSFQLQDERPVQQKHSHSEVDTNGSNVFFGDDNLNPTGPKSLQMLLQKKLNTELTGKVVSLSDFIVSVYEPPVSLPNHSPGLDPDPIAEGLVLGFERIRSEKTVQVQVTGKIGNTPFSSSISENFKGRVTENNIVTTVQKTLEDVVSQIQEIVAVK